MQTYREIFQPALKTFKVDIHNFFRKKNQKLCKYFLVFLRCLETESWANLEYFSHFQENQFFLI